MMVDRCLLNPDLRNGFVRFVKVTRLAVTYRTFSWWNRGLTLAHNIFSSHSFKKIG